MLQTYKRNLSATYCESDVQMVKFLPQLLLLSSALASTPLKPGDHFYPDHDARFPLEWDKWCWTSKSQGRGPWFHVTTALIETALKGGNGIYDRTTAYGEHYGHLIIPHRSIDQYDVTIGFSWIDAGVGYRQAVYKEAATTDLVSSSSSDWSQLETKLPGAM